MPSNPLKQRLALLVAAVPLLGGCATYEAKPLGLADHLRSLPQRDAESASRPEMLRPAVEAALTLLDPVGASTATTRPSGTLSLDEAERVALVLNRDVRIARGRALGQAATVSFAGLLDDLLVDVEVLRVVEDVEEPWIFGAGIGFTLPLSGRLGLERDVAGAEAGLEWRRAVAAEHDAILELRRRWLRWSAALERVEILNDYLDALAAVIETAERLAVAGEVAPTEPRLLAIEAASRRAELAQAEANVALARAAVLETMGLLPMAEIDLVPLPLTVRPASPPELPSADVLLRHPDALLAEAAYEASERRLRLEVRRQFPDLFIGPRYEGEDDQTRLGVGLTLLPLPIYNRNRRGIAEADAARLAARSEAEAAVEELASDYVEARLLLGGAVAKLRVLDEDVRPLVERQQSAIRELANLGELDVLVLSDVFRASLNLRRDAVEARLQAGEAGITIDDLLDPPVARPGSATTQPSVRNQP